MESVLCYDLETLDEMFLCVVYVPGEHFRRWEISKWKNDIYSFVKFAQEHTPFYWIGYNNLRFDSQVVEWILRHYEEWFDKTGLEIAAMIAQKAQDVIDDSNYDVFPEYREEQLTLKQLDPFRINHFDNKNRRISLKRLEFEMDMEDIEEMPIPFNKKNLTREECVKIIEYCIKDVKATYRVYLITIGETDNTLYKENNQVETRQSIEDEYGIKCLNFSNAKIGDEIIKKFYCEEKGISYSELPRKGTFRKEIFLKNCIPPYVNFQTRQLQDFLKRIKKIKLTQKQDFVESIKFADQTYTFAKGGLHNVINGKIYELTDFYDIIDVDVSGYYPATIINNSYYPSHLGKAFLPGYKKIYFKRIALKPFSKKDKKIKGIVAGLKEAGNCPYGKSSDMSSWLYDKQMTLATCITGELSLLMFIEDCELEGISCIMANTDGATFIVPKGKKARFDEIKAAWLVETTRELTYELEEAYFKKLVFSSVNDYIGIKVGYEEAPEDKKSDYIKLKGDFMKDFELHKNKSARIVPIALYEYYVHNIPLEATIKNHR